MRQIAIGSVVVAIISMIIGVISRISMTPIRGIESKAMFLFAITCLLLAMTLIQLEKK